MLHKSEAVCVACFICTLPANSPVLFVCIIFCTALLTKILTCNILSSRAIQHEVNFSSIKVVTYYQCTEGHRDFIVVGHHHCKGVGQCIGGTSFYCRRVSSCEHGSREQWDLNVKTKV